MKQFKQHKQSWQGAYYEKKYGISWNLTRGVQSSSTSLVVQHDEIINNLHYSFHEKPGPTTLTLGFGVPLHQKPGWKTNKITK
jgi:hypothetical protein